MRSERVVVVEDDPNIRLIAVSMFEDAGLGVVAFANADDALAYMYENADDVAAMFTDLQMPGLMDGLVLAEVVGRHWPRVTVLLTSGRVRPMTALPPNTRFIAKPWMPSAVVDELNDALKTTRMMSI